MRKLLVQTCIAAGVVAGALAIAAPAASAAPTGAKNAFAGFAMCGEAGSFPFVVNNANGQGQGAQNNGQNQAEWAPAHLLNGSNGIFHPTAFNLTFTFTPAQGPPPPPFTNTDVRAHQTGDVTCQITGSQTDNEGNTFSLSGTVTGWIS